jgi:hypothetical protein
MPPQFKITLGDQLRIKLDEASSISMRSVAEEIRQRLEMSFDLQGDERTLDLIYATLFLARAIELDFDRTWWSNEKARSAFMAAIVDQIASYAVDPAQPPSQVQLKQVPDDPPDVIGRTLARNYRRTIRPVGWKMEIFDTDQFRKLMSKAWEKKKK